MKKIFLMSLVALLAVSCSEDTMDEINKDNSNPAVDKVGAKFMITDAIMSTGYTTTSGAYAWYISSFTEQEFGTGNNQLMKAELRNPVEVMASTTYNNEWNGTYGNLMNIKTIIDKCTAEGSPDNGKLDILGMAQVLEAINFGVLTDLHGDIPCSDRRKFTNISSLFSMLQSLTLQKVPVLLRQKTRISSLATTTSNGLHRPTH